MVMTRGFQSSTDLKTHGSWGLVPAALSVESQLEKSKVSKNRYKKERMAFFAKDKYLCYEWGWYLNLKKNEGHIM